MLRAASAAALALILAQPACAGDQPPAADTEHGKVRVVTVAEGLEHPWGMAFLPDGRALVTERPGRLRIVGIDGKLGAPLEGVPAVSVTGQGGLLDVQLDPEFAQNRWVFFLLPFREIVGYIMQRNKCWIFFAEGSSPCSS